VPEQAGKWTGVGTGAGGLAGWQGCKQPYSFHMLTCPLVQALLAIFLPPHRISLDEVARLSVWYAVFNPPLFPCTFALCRKSLDEVARLYGSGSISVNVSHRFSLAEAPDAFQIMLNRQARAVALVVALHCSAGGSVC